MRNSVRSCVPRIDALSLIRAGRPTIEIFFSSKRGADWLNLEASHKVIYILNYRFNLTLQIINLI